MGPIVLTFVNKLPTRINNWSLMLLLGFSIIIFTFSYPTTGQLLFSTPWDSKADSCTSSTFESHAVGNSSCPVDDMDGGLEPGF